MVEMYVAVESPGHALHRVFDLDRNTDDGTRLRMKGTWLTCYFRLFDVLDLLQPEETVRDKEHEDALKELIGKARTWRYHEGRRCENRDPIVQVISDSDRIGQPWKPRSLGWGMKIEGCCTDVFPPLPLLQTSAWKNGSETKTRRIFFSNTGGWSFDFKQNSFQTHQSVARNWLTVRTWIFGGIACTRRIVLGIYRAAGERLG